MIQANVLRKETWITVGATRSLIVNGKNGQFMLIPNDVAKLLSNKSFKREDFGENYEFFDYLHTEGYIAAIPCSQNYSLVASAPEIRNSDSSLIIDIDNESNIDFVCDRLKQSEQQFDYVQLRVYSKINSLDQLLLAVHNVAGNGVELAVNFALDAEEIFIQYPKLYYIQIFGQGYTNVLIEGVKIIEYIDEELLDESSCGKVCNRNFVFSSQFKARASSGNSCLNNKFSIDRNGNYKNCPSMQTSYGNVTDASLHSAIRAFNVSSEKQITKITKLQVDECKVCEFRDVCVDCRAIRSSEDLYSKPKKCRYNPIIGKWFAAFVMFFLTLNFYTSAQNVYRVLDATNQAGVPFGKVLWKQQSTVLYTDETGTFHSKIALEDGDTIKIIAYGYEITEIVIEKTTLDTFLLHPDGKVLLIDEVTVKPKEWVDLTLNEFERPEFGNLSLLSGGIIASYIDKSKFARGKISQVDVFIKSLDSMYNLKMKLFTYDFIRNCPGEAIKIADYYVNFTGEVGWYSIKLNDTIFIPEGGICVGFEAIPKSNFMQVKENQCGISSVVFSSYYEKLENGDRTSFTPLQNNNWHTPSPHDLKVSNVLNLAVKVKLYGQLNVPEEDKPKLISSRKVTRKLKAKSYNEVLNHATIEELFQSIVKCIEQNNLLGISQLIVVTKENKFQFNEFVDRKRDNWLTEEEQDKALIEWNYFVHNLDRATISFLSEGYSEIIFPNESSLFIYREIDGWKISPYYKNLIN